MKLSGFYFYFFLIIIFHFICFDECRGIVLSSPQGNPGRSSTGAHEEIQDCFLLFLVFILISLSLIFLFFLLLLFLFFLFFFLCVF